MSLRKRMSLKRRMSLRRKTSLRRRIRNEFKKIKNENEMNETLRQNE